MKRLRFAILPALALSLSLFPRAAHADPAPAEDPDTDPSDAPAERPHHQGFTLELGLGAAFTNVAPEQGDSKGQFGLAPLSFSLGGFVSPDVAVLVRGAGSSYFENGPNGNQQQYVNAFYGLHVQYWINDRFMISGGPGVTLFGKNQLLGPAEDPETGYGASIRAGYALLAIKHHVVRISYEAFPSVYPKSFVFGNAINLEWQYF